jgi:hypothetical protein
VSRSGGRAGTDTRVRRHSAHHDCRMSRIPHVTGADLLAALSTAGFAVIRIKGSHRQSRGCCSHHQSPALATIDRFAWTSRHGGLACAPAETAIREASLARISHRRLVGHDVAQALMPAASPLMGTLLVRYPVHPRKVPRRVSARQARVPAPRPPMDREKCGPGRPK